jgi:hypothetical protein
LSSHELGTNKATDAGRDGMEWSRHQGVAPFLGVHSANCEVVNFLYWSDTQRPQGAFCLFQCEIITLTMSSSTLHYLFHLFSVATPLLKLSPFDVRTYDTGSNETFMADSLVFNPKQYLSPSLRNSHQFCDPKRSSQNITMQRGCKSCSRLVYIAQA